jgi:AlkA-like protein
MKMMAGQGGITLYLTYRPPFDWHTLVRLKAHATPGTEVIDDECYRRSIEINGQAGEIEVGHEPEESRLRVRVILPSYEQLILVVETGATNLRSRHPPVTDYKSPRSRFETQEDVRCAARFARARRVGHF